MRTRLTPEGRVLIRRIAKITCGLIALACAIWLVFDVEPLRAALENAWASIGSIELGKRHAQVAGILVPIVLLFLFVWPRYVRLFFEKLFRWGSVCSLVIGAIYGLGFVFGYAKDVASSKRAASPPPAMQTTPVPPRNTAPAKPKPWQLPFTVGPGTQIRSTSAREERKTEGSPWSSPKTPSPTLRSVPRMSTTKVGGGSNAKLGTAKVGGKRNDKKAD